MGTLERALADLFAGPLDTFVQRRNALAAEQKDDRETADRIKKLRKPSVPAWAINRLLHDDPAALTELIKVGDRLVEAHERLMAGGGADALRDAGAEERKVVARLTERAGRIVEDAGSTVTASYEERISETLSAIAVDDDARATARAGVLDSDLRRAGFGLEGFASKVPAGSSRSASKKTKSKTKQAADEPKETRAEAVARTRALERLERLRDAARRATEAATSAREQARDAERVATRARRDAEVAEREAEAARERAETAERRADEARAAVENAER